MNVKKTVVAVMLGGGSQGCAFVHFDNGQE